MESFDGAKVCEMVGLFLSHQLAKLVGKSNIGLYRDDDLAIVDASGPDLERLRKKIIKLLQSHGSKIISSTNLVQTDFLDVTLDLKLRKYWPYRKFNDQPLYIHHQSNHPPAIKKQLPPILSNRLSQLSCNQEEFEKAASDYQEAMLKSEFAGELEYVKTNGSAKRSRKRNIVWFNPPYSEHVKTNPIEKKFLKLVAIHFPHHHRLHKISNKNNIKVSYSCMPNMTAIISKHNKLRFKTEPIPTVPLHRVTVGIRPTALWKENAAKAPLYTKLH